ncbi:hypothetical protein HDU93_001702, partial [Gonapodya sp. JEL0774]
MEIQQTLMQARHLVGRENQPPFDQPESVQDMDKCWETTPSSSTSQRSSDSVELQEAPEAGCNEQLKEFAAKLRGHEGLWDDTATDWNLEEFVQEGVYFYKEDPRAAIPVVPYLQDPEDYISEGSSEDEEPSNPYSPLTEAEFHLADFAISHNLTTEALNDFIRYSKRLNPSATIRFNIASDVHRYVDGMFEGL